MKISTKEVKQMASKGQKFKKVPLETKLKAVRERLEEGKNFTSLGKKYGVSPETVKTWARIFKRDGGLGIRKRGKAKKDEPVDYKERYEILKKYQEYLREVDPEKK